MGRIAAEKADTVIVTDDNPRSEKPEAIRAEILAGAPGAIEIGDRARRSAPPCVGWPGATCCWWPARVMRRDRLSDRRCCRSPITRRTCALAEAPIHG
jgi:hypothetical protein